MQARRWPKSASTLMMLGVLRARATGDRATCRYRAGSDVRSTGARFSVRPLEASARPVETPSASRFDTRAPLAEERFHAHHA